MRRFYPLLIIAGLAVSGGIAYASFATSEFGEGLHQTGSTSTVINNGQGVQYDPNAADPSVTQAASGGSAVSCSQSYAQNQCAALGVSNTSSLTAAQIAALTNYELAANELEYNKQFSTSDYPGFANLDTDGDGNVANSEVTNYLKGTIDVNFSGTYPEQATAIFREIGACSTVNTVCLQGAVNDTAAFIREILGEALDDNSSVFSEIAALLESGTVSLLTDADNDGIADYGALAIFDSNDDGNISNAEIVNLLASDPNAGDQVNTSNDGLYARAYLIELAKCADFNAACLLQAIIDGNSYAVYPPQINAPTLALTATDATVATDAVTVYDGTCATAGGSGCSDGTPNVIFDDLDVFYPHVPPYTWDGTGCTSGNCPFTDNPFTIGTNGMITPNPAVPIDNQPAGNYTVTVTATDNNTNTYGESTESDAITVTVSNENGCILNNGISASDFSASGNITGAAVSISGNHTVNDKLFVQGASATAIVGGKRYTNFGYGSGTGSNDVYADYTSSSGILRFYGTRGKGDWVAILKKVGYIYDATGNAANATRSLIFSLSNRVPYLHSDGKYHFYEFVASNSIHFDTARAAAAATGNKLFGLQGYLATLTSAAENEYVRPKIQGEGWLGGCDNLGNATTRTRCGVSESDIASDWRAEGKWVWVTGPEKGTPIGTDASIGTCNGAHSFILAAPYNFSRIVGSEPNNCSNENMLHTYGNGTWNDYHYTRPHIQGYLVEWGGTAGDPTVDLTETHSYNMTTEGQFCAHQ